MDPGNPEKVVEFYNAGPGKSWKSIDSCKKVLFKNSCLQYYFWISIL